jgi:hypothetical protein
MVSLLGAKSMKINGKRKIPAAASTLYIHCKKWETKLQETGKVYSSHLGNTLLQDLIQPVMSHCL